MPDRNSRSGYRGLLTVITGAILVAAFAAPVEAAAPAIGSAAAAHQAASWGPGSAVGGSIVIQNAGGFLILGPAPGMTPHTWDPAADAARIRSEQPVSPVHMITVRVTHPAASVALSHAGTSAVRPDGSGYPGNDPGHLFASKVDSITPPGGSAGNVQETFTDSLPYDGGLPTTGVSFCGNSAAKWLGHKPYDATQVDLINDWHVDGWIISVSYPAGIGITFSGQDLTDTVSTTNYWATYEDYSTCPIHFGGLLTGASQSVSGRYKFGANNYLRGPATDSAFI